jgi:hypothetical protein
MILLIQLMYYLVFLMMLLMSLFIVFHIVRYSYNKTAKLTMLLIFVPVVSILLFTNFILFSQIQIENIFSIFLQ